MRRRRRRRARGAEDLERQHLRVRRDAGDADAVVGRAAIVPATCVPWKLAWSSTLLSLLTKSQPCQSSTQPLPSSSTPLVSRPMPLSPGLLQSWPARSGCVELDAGVDDRDRRARRRAWSPRPRARRCRRPRRPGAQIVCPVLCRPHWLAEVRVALAGRAPGRPARRRRRRRPPRAPRSRPRPRRPRDHHLGVAQRQRLLERDARVGAEVGALGAVKPGHALDDDGVRRGDGGEGERGDERADGERSARSPVVGEWGRGLRGLAGCPLADAQG